MKGNNHKKTSTSCHLFEVQDQVLKINIYIVILMLVVSVCFIVSQDFSQAKLDFKKNNNRIFQSLFQRILVVDTVLKSFTAFVSTHDVLDTSLTDQYMSRLVKTYDFIDSFLVSKKEMNQQEQPQLFVSVPVFSMDEKLTYVSLILNQEKLFSVVDDLPENFSLTLLQKKNDSNSPVVLSHYDSNDAFTIFEKGFMPQFKDTKQLGSMHLSQSFLLQTQWKMHVNDFNLRLLSAVVLIAMVFLFGIKKYSDVFVKSKVEKMEDEGTLYYLANFDALTGIPNRNSLLKHMETILLRAKRYKSKFSVLFIDIDQFKPINDQFGHCVGDDALASVATRLVGHLREDEMLGRYGGDEFILVSETGFSDKDFQIISNRIKQEFMTPILPGKYDFFLGVSIGYAVYPDDGVNISALIEVADENMYQDKKNRH